MAVISPVFIFLVLIIVKYFVSSECDCLSHFSSNTFLQEEIRSSSFYSSCMIIEKTVLAQARADKHQIITLKSLFCQKTFFHQMLFGFFITHFLKKNQDFPIVSLALNKSFRSPFLLGNQCFLYPPSPLTCYKNSKFPLKFLKIYVSCFNSFPESNAPFTLKCVRRGGPPPTSDLIAVLRSPLVLLNPECSDY